MDPHASNHADEQHGEGRRLARLIGAAGLTAAVVGGLIATGSLGYVGTALGQPNNSSASQQYDGTRPGWGCGDRNHVHTGPPGRQYAPPPPGCTR